VIIMNGKRDQSGGNSGRKGKKGSHQGGRSQEEDSLRRR
jgi:hypothetical protein